MAVGSSVRQSKQTKSGEDRDAGGGNCLDDFPDEVLLRILSMVPIKDAVKMSLLSKRWQHLWLAIPKLRLHEKAFPGRSIFMNFVDRVLLLRDPISVEEFTLSCNVNSDAARINSWLAAVVKRNVQGVCLWVGLVPEPSGLLPYCLFRCETLMTLGLYMAGDLIIPSSVRLSSLKVLALRHVRFVDYDSVQNLFSCPALESLYLDRCHWVGLDNVTISAPSLQILSILDPYDKYGEHYYHPCKVVINGANVKQFTYDGDLMYEYSLVGSSSSAKAFIYVSSDKKTDSFHTRASTLLEGLYNVGTLTLSAAVFKCIASKDLFKDSPVFCNMTELKLEGGDVSLDSEPLATLLRRSPCLRVLEFHKGFQLSLNQLMSRVLLPVPACFESQLKKIVVHRFSATGENFLCVAVLLMKAMVLEEMVLYYEKTDNEPTMAEYDILTQLNMLGKSSKKCKISLIR